MRVSATLIRRKGKARKFTCACGKISPRPTCAVCVDKLTMQAIKDSMRVAWGKRAEREVITRWNRRERQLIADIDYQRRK